MVGEVVEKVHLIHDSLAELDLQLGELQDLSALAVDTLTLLSASDSIHQEEARLAQCQPVSTSRTTLPHRSGDNFDVLNMRRLMSRPCKSSPRCALTVSRMVSPECPLRGRMGGTPEGQEV